jgi:HEPN domain-containing protein
MTSDRFARDYLRRAQARRRALDTLLDSEAYPDAVRESQDLVELVLKRALRLVGVEPPKRHDVHSVVERFLERFPAGWRTAFAELRQALGELAQDRAPAFYGDEAEGVPASELYGEEDARRAVMVADRLLGLYAELLRADG